MTTIQTHRKIFRPVRLYQLKLKFWFVFILIFIGFISLLLIQFSLIKLMVFSLILVLIWKILLILDRREEPLISFDEKLPRIIENNLYFKDEKYFSTYK
ncbi:hypothetical protein [Aureivirga sp. CE67]|uniref:hypothetical protein n=1 Tax=Aureivirga sp. CE67 TaxID=1788983 RepID=UPI0018CBE573|nr:hypothetical protein [Aureivirga sp. CE67]